MKKFNLKILFLSLACVMVAGGLVAAVLLLFSGGTSVVLNPETYPRTLLPPSEGKMLVFCPDTGSSPEECLALLSDYGASGVVVPGPAADLSGFLEAAETVPENENGEYGEERTEIYLAWNLGGPEKESTLSELEKLLKENPGISGVLFSDWECKDPDALLDVYSDASQESIDGFITRLENERLQAGLTLVGELLPETLKGAVVSLERLPDACLSGSAADLVFFRTSSGMSPEETVLSAEIWKKLSGSEAEFCLYSDGLISASAFSETLSYLENSISGGYCLSQFPIHAELGKEDGKHVKAENPGEMTAPSEMDYYYSTDTLLSDHLIVNRPLSQNSSGSASTLLFTGIAPIGSEIRLDGEKVEQDIFGHFHYDVPLYMGDNSIRLEVNGETRTYTYYRNRLIVYEYSPAYNACVDGGSEMPVWMRALKGSVVTATLGDQTVYLSTSSESGVPYYMGSIKLPEGEEEQVSLGNLVFRVKYDGISQTVTAGEISLNPSEMNLPEWVEVSAQDSKFKDDGSAIVYPIEPYGAHAPDLPDWDAADNSNWEFYPVANGALDRVIGCASYSGVLYYNLFSGVRIAASDLTETETPAEIDNAISSLTMVNDGYYTRIVLTMTRPVMYQAAADAQSFRISFSDTVSVPENLLLERTPLFTSADWNGSELVLALRTENGFLGYDARYEGNRLILTCTNPPVSGSIVGARICVDPGHGGFGTELEDVGAFCAGFLDEAQLNWYIGSYLTEYLEQLGADPVLTPSWEEALTVIRRADIASVHRSSMNLSIHHDAATSGYIYGVGTYYYQNYSEPLAALVQEKVVAVHNEYTPVPDDHDNGLYHTRYMFTLRTDWVSLMLEDGFVCYGDTYTNLVTPEFQCEVARAIAEACKEYYARFADVAGWKTGMETTL